MKIRIDTPKPRNPFAMAGRLRAAGAHRRSRAGQRQQGRRELQLQLRHEHPPAT